MMDDLAAIYDEAFFAEWGRGNERYVRAADAVTEILVAQFRPKRAADLGCGCGVYGDALRRRGVEVVSLDGVRAPAAHAFPGEVHLQDLTVPFENRWGAFDLALCLEVAEHIPEVWTDVFLDNLVRFSDRLLLSAAPPNQGGHHHVNEQPKRYWVRRLAERGFLYDRPATGRIFEALKPLPMAFKWMGQYISVYERSADPAKLKRRLPFSG